MRKKKQQQQKFIQKEMYREWRDWESFALFVCQNRINSKLSRNLQIIITIIFFLPCSVVYMLFFSFFLYIWCIFDAFFLALICFFLLLTRLHTNVYILIYRCIFAFAVIPIKVLFFFSMPLNYILKYIIRSFAHSPVSFVVFVFLSLYLIHTIFASWLAVCTATTPKSSEN